MNPRRRRLLTSPLSTISHISGVNHLIISDVAHLLPSSDLNQRQSESQSSLSRENPHPTSSGISIDFEQKERALKELCEKAFSEVAAERVLDEMVRVITVVNNRNKALILIEAWGESTSELRYLPVFEETYKSLKARGIRFPGRDNEILTPFFTPAQSVPAPEVNTELPQRVNEPQHVQYNVPVRSFTAEQTKEYV